MLELASDDWKIFFLAYLGSDVYLFGTLFRFLQFYFFR